MNAALIKWLSGLGSLLTFTFYLAYTHPIPQTNAETDLNKDSFDEETSITALAETQTPATIAIVTTREQEFEFPVQQEASTVVKESFAAQNQKTAPKKTTKPKVVKKTKPTNTKIAVSQTETPAEETPQPELEMVLPEPTMEPTPEILPEPTVDWSMEQPAPRKRIRSRAS